MHYHKLLLFLFIFLFCSTKYSLAQNYFYTAIKLPFVEFVDYALDKNSLNPNNPTAGLYFNAGYSINFAENFYTEIGIDYLVRSSTFNKFYDKIDKNKVIAEFGSENSAFAFQIKPLYNLSIDADDKTFLTTWCRCKLSKNI